MNKVMLIGRLTKSPDVRYTTGSQQMAVARFSLAVNRKVKRDGEPDADFISCIAFGKIAEFCEKYLTQGTKVAVEGHWQTGSFVNRDGVKIYTNDCILESIEFAESKKESQEPPKDEGFMDVPDGLEEELPFH